MAVINTYMPGSENINDPRPLHGLIDELSALDMWGESEPIS